MADDGKVADLDAARMRKAPTRIALGTMPDPKDGWPAGPFTVTISDADGKMFEVVFPDATGDLPEGATMLGTAGIPNVRALVANLMGSAIREFIGAR